MAKISRIADESTNRVSQLLEFLAIVAKAAKTANIDHFFRSGTIVDQTLLTEMAGHFLTVAMGFEREEFIPCIGGPEAPQYVPQSEDYYPWALFVVPTGTEDLMEVFHKRAMQYLHSDSAGKKNFVIITNLRSLIVCDLKHYIDGYELSFIDLYDSLKNNSTSKKANEAKSNWASLLQSFGTESAKEKKKKRRSDVISYVKPAEAHLGFVKRFGNLPNFDTPMGWDGKNFKETFKTKELPFLPTEEFDWNGKTKKSANRLIWGDNLAVIRSLPDESIDLIYLDPPFFSGRNYNCIFGDDDEVRTFNDIWDGGLPTYLTWLNARLWEMKRLLKKTGTLIVHLDWHAAHYVKVELDKIFGYENFGNEIIWCYAGGGISKGDFPKKHDNLLRYKKSDIAVYKPVMREYSESTKSVGRHSLSSGGGELNPLGTPINDWWADLKKLTSYNKGEWIGYPTQKPESLMERIINTCSNQGDVVADFFAGGGTTLTVAEKLGRRWIGCDISRIAISVIRDRLAAVYEIEAGIKRINDRPSFGFSVETHGAYDKSLVRSLDDQGYRKFVLQCYETQLNEKGNYIHGFKNDRAVHVAPAKGKTGVDIIEEFHTELSERKLRNGIILSWDWDKDAEKYVDSLKKGANGPDIQLVQVKLLDIDSHEFKGDNIRFLNKPAAVIRHKSLGNLKWIFDGTASQGRNNVDIHYYQWDFNFSGRFSPMTKPNFKNDQDDDINSNNDTKRVEYVFPSPGKYKVALRIIDKSGAEAIDVAEIAVSKSSKKEAA